MTLILEGLLEPALTIEEQHEAALQQSLAQEQLGYGIEVEVPRAVVVPKIISQETMAALGIRRRSFNRQLAAHPEDDSKMVITALKNRIY